MRDFTLYLHRIDPTRFSRAESRYETEDFAQEWNSAWKAYEQHVGSSSDPKHAQLRRFALSGWRQDLRDRRCIRKKPVSLVEFSLGARVADIKIDNEVTGRDLVIRYVGVTIFRWDDNVGLVARADASASGNSHELPILFLEEMRFRSDKLVEHELRFLDGSTLFIVAGDVHVNLSQYEAA